MRQADSRSMPGAGGVWQKKLTLNGLVVWAPDGGELAMDAVQIEHRARQRAEAARRRYRHGEGTALHAGHGGLNNRETNPQERLQPRHPARSERLIDSRRDARLFLRTRLRGATPPDTGDTRSIATGGCSPGNVPESETCSTPYHTPEKMARESRGRYMTKGSRPTVANCRADIGSRGTHLRRLVQQRRQ